MSAAKMPVGSRPIAVALGGMLALASALGIGRFVYTPSACHGRGAETVEGAGGPDRIG